MRKPLALISNDWHLHGGNTDLILDLAKQKCELVKKLGLNEVFILGDIFVSRKGQSQDVLTAFSSVLDIFLANDVKVHLIAGNHDKNVLSNNDSYLDVYRYHPALVFYSDFTTIVRNNIAIHLAPFYSDSVWIDKSKALNVKEHSTNVLFTHIGVTGSKNNDGTLVENSFNKDTFIDFDKVFSGHYHDHQNLYNGKFIHTPSLYQASFAENDNKGFTVVFDDLSFEILNSQFPNYIKIPINVDDITTKELSKLIKDYSTDEHKVRFDFYGSESKLKSIKKEMFEDAGIKVTLTLSEISESVELAESEITVNFDKASIIDEFKQFSKDNNWNTKDGLKYLKGVLYGES